MTTTDFGPDDLTQPPPCFPMILSLGCFTGVALFSRAALHLLPALVAGLVFTSWCMCLRAPLEYFGFITSEAACGGRHRGLWVVLLLTIAGAGIVALFRRIICRCFLIR